MAARLGAAEIDTPRGAESTPALGFLEVRGERLDSSFAFYCLEGRMASEEAVDRALTTARAGWADCETALATAPVGTEALATT